VQLTSTAKTPKAGLECISENDPHVASYNFYEQKPVLLLIKRAILGHAVFATSTIWNDLVIFPVIGPSVLAQPIRILGLPPYLANGCS